MTNEISAEGNDGSSCVSPRSDEHAEKKLTSRFRGVCWNKKNKRWQAAINHAGKYIYLGSFTAEEDAAKSFDRAAVKLRGQCAKINFPFSEYPAEMSWHKVVMQHGQASEQVLKNPRCLRDKAELPMDGMQSFIGTLPTPSFLTQPSCNFNHSVYQFHQTTGRPEPLQGRVIATQGQQPVQNGVMNPMYYYPVRGNSHIEMPMPCSVYLNGGSEMLAKPNPDAFTSSPVDLCGPAPRPQPRAQPTVAATQNPIVNILPQGAELTHWFSGTQNAFAMSFVRPETASTEVRLYDGRDVHEVGSFSSKDNAAQTCHNLLNLVQSLRPGNTTQSQSEKPQSDEPTTDTDDPEVAITGELKGKSPFEIRAGTNPVFHKAAETDQSEIPQKFDRPTIDLAQSDLKGRTNSAPLDAKSGSLKQRMGSLLQLEPTLSLGNLGSLSPATPSTSPRKRGPRSESDVKASSQSLRQSGSLQKMLSVLNQSGILGSIRKEDSEEDAADSAFPVSDLTFARSPEPVPTSAPQFLTSLGNIPHPYFALQRSEHVSLYMNNGSEHFTPFRKRKPVEMTLQNQACKKMKEANPAQNA